MAGMLKHLPMLRKHVVEGVVICKSPVGQAINQEWKGETKQNEQDKILLKSKTPTKQLSTCHWSCSS